MSFLPVAHAQDLGAYRQTNGALSAARQVRPSDVGASLQELDRAEAAFAKLRPTLRDPQLSRSVQSALDQARAALARTPADLQAQTLYAQALLRQALYTQTLEDLLRGTAGSGTQDEATTQARLQQLTQDFGLDQAETAALQRAAQAGQLEAVAARLQKAAARQIVRELAPWQNHQTLNRDDAYLRLTRASGWRLHLAELPGTPGAPAYAAALEQLAQGNLSGASPSIRQLYSAAVQTAQQLQRSLAASSPKPAAKQQTPTTPTPTTPAPSAASHAEVVGRATQEAKPASSGAAAESGSSVIVLPANPAPAPPQHKAAPTALPTGERKAATPVYAALARALAAAADQEQAAAHAALAEALQALSAAPAAWDKQDTAALAKQIRALSQRPLLESGEITNLLVQFRELEQPGGSGIAPAKAHLHAFAAQFWNSRNQAFAFFLLSLLLPLLFYFKFRALGHQKGEWAWIMTGIGLVLLPAFIEGLAALGSWLGVLTGNSVLQSASLLQVCQSELGHLLWWLFTLAGTLMMTAGFYQLSRRRAQLASAKARWAGARTQGDFTLTHPPVTSVSGPGQSSWAQPFRPPESGEAQPGQTASPPTHKLD